MILGKTICGCRSVSASFFLLLAWLAFCAPELAASDVPVAVEFLEPEVGIALFDQVTVHLRVLGEESVDRVEVFVDGRAVGVLRQPPWKWEVDVGSENREHRFEAVVHARDGATVRSQLVSPAIQVHETVELELQQLYLTVTRRDRRVVDLESHDFTLRDDGKKQQIVTLAGGEIPFTALLLIDSSGSMGGKPLEAALQGARRFVNEMAENDEAKALITSDRVLQSTPWTDDPDLFTAPLESSQADGGSAILDHLFLAFQLLEERLGRRVLILLSDGWDQHSSLTVEQLRRVSRRSQAMLYWVRLGAVDPELRRTIRPQYWVEDSGSNSSSLTQRIPLSVWRDLPAKRRINRAFEEMVEESGGRVVPVADPNAIEGAFQEILDELRQQIAIGYYPEPRRNDGLWREVKVRVKRWGFDVRTRKGYVDRQ